MEQKHPDRKIGLVTFNRKVTIIGDGSKQPISLADTKLDKYDDLLQNGITAASQQFTKPIRETKQALKKQLDSLEPNGQTALGPAILTSIALAGEGKQGSSVIVCTDGLANIGLGSLEELKTEEEKQKAKEFYEKIGHLAASKGVTVHLICIIGKEPNECDIQVISSIPGISGGVVERVQPDSLGENFALTLESESIATNVQLKIQIHRALAFKTA